MSLNYTNTKLIDFQKNYFDQDVEKNVRTYKGFVNGLIELQSYIAESGVKFPEWKLALDTLTTKYILHAGSFITLIGGTVLDFDKYKGKGKKIIDVPSAQVLLRAQLENFLIADFVYFQPSDENESLFRYNCWHYSSIKSLDKYKTDKPEIKEKIKSFEIELNSLWEQIESSKYFRFLTKNQQKQLKFKGSARLFNSWENLITKSNLNSLLFDNFYSFLSKNAHSESFGVQHLKHSKLGYHKNHKDAFLMLMFSQALTCLYITRITKDIKTAEIKFNTLSDRLIEDIRFYSTLLDENMLGESIYL